MPGVVCAAPQLLPLESPLPVPATACECGCACKGKGSDEYDAGEPGKPSQEGKELVADEGETDGGADRPARPAGLEAAQRL